MASLGRQLAFGNSLSDSCRGVGFHRHHLSGSGVSLFAVDSVLEYDSDSAPVSELRFRQRFRSDAALYSMDSRSRGDDGELVDRRAFPAGGDGVALCRPSAKWQR